ncbi:hypothetical protein [Paenibacillus sp. SAFN-117]|uniref:hypothetical protein n=1 Tax=Paenibacillus sp. SAFN-117 TaxID=3436860 RepID=UPI003F81BEED
MKLKRGRSQVLFKYLPGSVFQEKGTWFMVTELKIKELNGKTDHLLQSVYSYIEQWSSNSELDKNLYPTIDKMYYFGEIEEVQYEMFPLVFYCLKCSNVHPYRDLQQINRQNPRLRCEFCKEGQLKQYSYALVHPNGDIQPINVKSNSGSTWKERYDGVKMIDTRSFKTATWYNYKKKYHLGDLGTKSTTLPLTKTMKEKRHYTLGGTILSEGDIYYPALRSFVNLEHETLLKRKENENFPYIQIGGLFGLESVNQKNYSANFEKKENDTLKQMWLSAKTDDQKAFVRMFAEKQNIDIDKLCNEISSEVNQIFDNEVPTEVILDDRSLHEFVFSWYENSGQSLELKLREATDNCDFVQETLFKDTQDAFKSFGIQTAMLVEKFPVLMMAIGYTRKSFDRSKAVLNPFRQRINDRERIIIPILKNENEAIIFKLDPSRVLAWLIINDFFPSISVVPNSKEKAHAIIYKHLCFTKYNIDELSRLRPNDAENDKKILGTIMTFKLIHSYIHSLLQAGKTVLGLDIDSLTEYIFPSSLAGAIYVSKLEGGGMGALTSAFDNDLKRWINGLYEKVNTCLYDPVCHQHSGVCHACMYLKFSCSHFNHGLSRNLIIGGIDKEFNEDIEIKGYLSPQVDQLLKEWGI